MIEEMELSVGTKHRRRGKRLSLTRQFRMPNATSTATITGMYRGFVPDCWIGDKPLRTVLKRETGGETGYLNWNAVQKLFESLCLLVPVTEIPIFFYCSYVRKKMKVSDGGGAETETAKI